MIVNARTTDPESSHIAGAEVEQSGIAEAQRSIVLAAVKLRQGLTSKELASQAGLDRYMVARRLSEIKSVKKGDMRICSISKRLCVTWWLK